MDSLQNPSRPTRGKLRASCDRCQDTKVRCDQEKPECHRCVRKALPCTYSPIKRFGRPRKGDAAAHRAGIEEQRARPLHPQRRESHARVPANLGSQEDAGRQWENTSSTASSITDTATPGGHRRVCGDEYSTVSASTRFANEDYSSLGPSSGNELSMTSGEMIDSTCEHVSNITSAAFAEPGEAPAPLIPGESPWLPNNLQLGHGLELNTSGLPYADNRRTESNMPRGSHNVNQEAHEAHIADTQAPLDPNPDKDCYVAILTRLIRLEESLEGALPPAVEVLFKAESDTRDLQARLFSCRGHQGPCGHRTINCLDSFRPVLHVLALLVERVVRVLEDLFRRAAMLGKDLKEAQQVSTSTVSRRLERSVRSLLDCTYICPLPEAHVVLKIGEYEVHDEVKGQTLRRLWRLRMRKLLVMLADMRTQSQKVGEAASPHGIFLGKDGRSTFVDEATEKLIDDLYMRVQALKGRLDIVR